MKHHILSIWFIIIISTTLYTNTLKNGFVYDDEYTIVSNTLINKLDNLHLLLDKKDYFARSAENSYRPVVTLTYFIDHALYGPKPRGYHLTNILLHTINAILLYTFITLLYKHISTIFALEEQPKTFNPKPLIISLLFVAHPVLTEAVNAISYREDLLVFAFYIAALITFLHIRTRGRKRATNGLLYLTSYLLYSLALLSKEMAVTFPLIIYCCEWFYSGKKEMTLRSFLFNRFNIGYSLITIGYLILRFYLFQNPNEEIEAWEIGKRFSTIPYFILRYLYLLIAPVSLSADYVTPPVRFFSPIFIVSLLAVISIFAIIFHLSKNRSEIGFGAAFFILTLLPVYNIIPIANPLAERYLYLPSVGFVIIVTVILDLVFKAQIRYTVTSILLILCIYSLMVIKRNEVWNDNYSLWADTIAKVPNSSRAHNHLGNIYYSQNRLEEAMPEYMIALKLRPDYAQNHYNIGNAYLKKGYLDEAIRSYMTALKLKPDYADASNNLGSAYLKKGLLDEGIREFKTTLKLKPSLAEAHVNIGNAYLEQGRIYDAVWEYSIAIELKPNYAQGHYNLGNAYLKIGRLDDAIRKYMMALKLKPDYTNAYRNLGFALYKMGRIDEAIDTYRTALQINPSDAEIIYLLEKLIKERESKMIKK